MAKPQGKLVQVNEGKMHIRKMGSGEKVIILLAGLGCPLPTVEFAPLMRKLSDKYTIYSVEYFGYGYSDSTGRPRTNENYVSEIREALKSVGLTPPYVLMPYSISGVYAEYYAAKFPKEVAGLILLDSTPTVEEFAKIWAYTEEDIEKAKAVIESGELPEDTPYDEDIVKEIYAEFMKHGYTMEELEEIDEIPNHLETLIAQEMAFSPNILEVSSMPFPGEIPVLALSGGLVELDDDERVKYEDFRKDHMARLGDRAKLVIVEGSEHGNIYYHRDFRGIISKEIDEFLKFT